jgi:hypothetical protein
LRCAKLSTSQLVAVVVSQVPMSETPCPMLQRAQHEPKAGSVLRGSGIVGENLPVRGHQQLRASAL